MALDHNNLEKQIRIQVRRLKHFYETVAIYALCNGAFILLWALSGGGYFWPFWTLLIWGAFIFFWGESQEVLPDPLQKFMNGMRAKLPFSREDWEEKQVKRRLRRAGVSVVHDVKKAAAAVKKETPMALKAAAAAEKRVVEKAASLKKKGEATIQAQATEMVKKAAAKKKPVKKTQKKASPKK